jgi:hypothetical protein
MRYSVFRDGDRMEKQIKMKLINETLRTLQEIIADHIDGNEDTPCIELVKQAIVLWEIYNDEGVSK